MAEDNEAGQAGTGEARQPAPTINIVGQYIKDLSFENPAAPANIVAGGANPSFNVSINVSVKKQDGDVYAVEMPINVKAERDGDMLFNVELIYGGLFRVQNVADNQMAPVLMIECPRLIFPFARQIIATTSQGGGFPPVMLEPVDFTAIYRQNLQRMQQASQQGGQAGTPEPTDAGGQSVKHPAQNGADEDDNSGKLN